MALYDRLLAAGPLPDDVKQVFDHNRMASLDHHKPAFERCAGVATAQGAGRGAATVPGTVRAGARAAETAAARGAGTAATARVTAATAAGRAVAV